MTDLASGDVTHRYHVRSPERVIAIVTRAPFWTANDLIEVPEAWEIAWESGLALFRRELLVDADWEVEGAEHYGLSSDLAQLAIGIARRAAIRIPLVELSPSELQRLVPESSDHRDEALDLLLTDKLFTVTS
ncbi:MAG: hypothetical protein R3F14_00780 [Polyangiaceae bacterium]